MSTKRYRLGVDIGGTFTDFQVMEEASGALFSLKVPSTKFDPCDAVITGIKTLEARFGISPKNYIYFAHGTTLGVNTLLERNGARGGVVGRLADVVLGVAQFLEDQKYTPYI